jgi:hypothetical protein
MDPFIEDQEWTDFHARCITVIGEVLTPSVRHRYVVRVERRVYVEHHTGESDWVVPDVAVLRDAGARPASGAARTASRPLATAPRPVECLVPMPVTKRETYLVIRGTRTNEVVTVIELLSPTNKTRGSDGFREYIERREKLLQSAAHLVEVDLLRRGEGPPVIGSLPDLDYRALVCRRQSRPKAQAYGWSLRDRLPTLPVPLSEDDPEADLDLQQVFTTTYERAAYEDSIDYAATLNPPLRADDDAWVREILGRRQRGST